jgi:hypothetical protein
MAMAVDDISATFIKDSALSTDCSGFVRAVAIKVATEYGLNSQQFIALFAGQADDIRGRFDKSPFVFIKHDKDLATRLANEGQLVLGGMSAHEYRVFNPDATQGHVVVIAPGGPSKSIPPSDKRPKKGAHGGYPYCYQGSDNPDNVYMRKTQVDAVFRSHSLPYINYAYIEIVKKG